MFNALRHALRMQLLPLALIFAILVALIGTRTALIEMQRDNTEAVRDTFQLDRNIVLVLGLVQDAEIGQRGFLLTGELAYRAPYDQAVLGLPRAFEIIRAAVEAGSPRAVQFAQLQSAISDKLAELQETISLYERGDPAQAMAIIRTDRGRQLMDRVRSIVADMRRDENALLEMRLDRADSLGEWLRVGSIASALAILALALFGFLDMRKRIRAVVAAHDSLAAANSALHREIATREQAEAQLRQMQKMEAIGQLTGGVAHDFNNMLAVITSAMNLIQRKLARGEGDIGQFVESAADAAQRAAKLTARLLAFSRQQPLAPQSVDANRLVAGMSDLMRRTLGESVAVETVLAGGLWRAHVDPSELENAVLNLAINSRDAMPEGGRLTIESANAHLDEAYAARHNEVVAGQYVMLAVSDTGTGMTPDVVAKAFDPFFTTKAVSKGTGLGLSQVFGFVKQSGGHVKIYSELGQGTTVRIYLPRHFGDEPAAAASSASRSMTTPTETVLVVEDDDRVRAGTVMALRELGYAVIEAEGAETALHRLGEQPDIDLLFTDIVMPGVNGRKLADEAKRRHPGLKVLFTTGFTRNAVVHNGVLDPGVQFIAKPFTIDQLAEKLRDVFND